jgi:hypothetical protein
VIGAGIAIAVVDMDEVAIRSIELAGRYWDKAKTRGLLENAMDFI